MNDCAMRSVAPESNDDDIVFIAISLPKSKYSGLTRRCGCKLQYHFFEYDPWEVHAQRTLENYGRVHIRTKRKKPLSRNMNLILI